MSSIRCPHLPKAYHEQAMPSTPLVTPTDKGRVNGVLEDLGLGMDSFFTQSFQIPQQYSNLASES